MNAIKDVSGYAFLTFQESGCLSARVDVGVRVVRKISAFLSVWSGRSAAVNISLLL